ncbi:MAG: tRNA pseudouridine(55) synthase TruB [Dehalococcoidales bacterium]|jgi:tRNA pseudouridine55 synthase|nr:tRNA pseudouridine(55) synthase TruB [Dehalococcoidales bacterium]MDP6221772.1 tRNA pseudouridine(55) synthase TruB [Dehalococcoidales bacterium]MDP7109552.1 tRNA pseudouridine(55) synthase TruB [Dehalococcoidales bacterium]MDP7309769.1 tRNA pseudouridine(55) synthase TruB [Dehalococcoidales bacterium]MDP7409298.1 tRNA pseudouridine(55) synthase TruB [Dehalococcoidales bacterium]|tara:strand:- start:908 stop:1825 length:918 start_codon:yes stop_codon:yes gene_type:complete
MIGILNIDKPAGITSFQVVALVKRLSGERRVGHAGTLDPIATGVLPICLGQATRVIEFLAETTKTYRAEIIFGMATDTYDTSGQVTQRGDPSTINRNRLESELTSFYGLIWQTPPMYSAVKYQGKPLYKLARAGITVKRQSRLAHVYSLKLITWQSPVAIIEVVCGKGTYIRSIAHDLGQALGCGATLQNLTRLRYGPFDVKDALSLSQLEDAFRYDYWPDLIHPPDSVLRHWAAVVIGNDAREDMRMGRSLVLDDEDEIPATEHLLSSSISGKRRRAYTLDGRFIGVLRFNPVSRQWQPEKVLL